MLDVMMLLDRSGSMQAAKTDHEGGLRSFVEDQKRLGDDMRFTFVQFDGPAPCEIVIDGVPLAEVDPSTLTLVPRGDTPLLDAIGLSVAHLRKRLTPQDNVIVVVITDGEENASHEWTKPKVKALLDELEAANWKFLFLGASFAAFTEGESLGVAAGASANYNASSPIAVGAMYRNLSSNTAGTRAASASGMPMMQAKQQMNFTTSQVLEMNDESLPAGDTIAGSTSTPLVTVTVTKDVEEP